MLGWPPCLQALAATTLAAYLKAQTNQCSSNLLASSAMFLQRFTLSLGFPFSAPCGLQIHLATRSSSSFLCAELHPILLDYSLHQVQKQDTPISLLCSDLRYGTYSFEHITNQPLLTHSPILVHRCHCPETAPFGARYAIVQGQPNKAIPLASSSQPHSQLIHPHNRAELIALTPALTLAKERKINIYTLTPSVSISCYILTL